jgi:hypothetical protein
MTGAPSATTAILIDLGLIPGMMGDGRVAESLPIRH